MNAIRTAAGPPRRSPWPLAWPTLLILGLNEALGGWAQLAHADCGSGRAPTYALWAATEHTSRTALALTLVLWAIMPGSSGPTVGTAQID